MKGRRIIFLRRSLAVGGSERQLVTLANALARRGFDVTVVSMYSTGIFSSSLDREQVRLVGLDKKGRRDLIGFTKRLVSQCRRLRPDTIYGFSPTDNLFALLIKRFVGRPRVVWGVRASNVELARYGLLSQLIFRLACLLSGCPDLIIANSCAGRNYHSAHGFPERTMIVIPNGIDTDYFRPEPEEGRRVRAALSIPEGAKAIALVGRLDPMKGHEIFIRAAGILRTDRPRLKFICVGEGSSEYQKELLRLAGALHIGDDVIWAGRRTDMPAVYSAMDLCVSASTDGEGFCNAIGEAMACGVPCVVTDVGDSAQIVGDSGVVVPPNDVFALAEGVRRLLCRLESGVALVGREARQRIVENFNVDRLAGNTIAALAQLS